MQTKVTKIARLFLITPYFLIVPISWLLLMVFYSPTFGYDYSRDTYGYYLVSKNIFSGEWFSSSALRDFYLTSVDNFFPTRSFPPIWPTLIGFLDKIIDKGIVSSLYVNLAITYAILFTWFKYSLKFDKGAIVLFGSLLFFLFVNDPFSNEILSGRSIPVVLLFLILCFNVLSTDYLSKSRCLIAGILLALISLTRSDCLLFALLAPLTVFARKDGSWRDAITIYVGLLLTSAPWLIRNLTVFGAPFASDNTLTALSTFPATIPITYFSDGPPLLTEDYKLWAAQRIKYFLDNIKVVNTLLTPLGGWVITAFSLSGLFLSLCNKKSDKQVLFYALTWLWVFCNLASVSLTPFHDHRYFSISAFLIFASGLLTIINTTLNNSAFGFSNTVGGSQKKREWLIHGLIGVSALTFIVNTYSEEFKRNGADGYIGLKEAFSTIIKPGELVGAEDAETQSYYTGWKTVYLPTNTPTVDSNFLAWAKKWKVKYILVDQSSPLISTPQFVQKGTFKTYVLLDITAAIPADTTPVSTTPKVTNTAHNLTDPNWVNGVAKNWSGFFIAYHPRDQNRFKPGVKIKFADGSIRTVTKQEILGSYINITVSGVPLDGKIVGYPNEFEIQE